MTAGLKPMAATFWRSSGKISVVWNFYSGCFGIQGSVAGSAFNNLGGGIVASLLFVIGFVSFRILVATQNFYFWCHFSVSEFLWVWGHVMTGSFLVMSMTFMILVVLQTNYSWCYYFVSAIFDGLIFRGVRRSLS